MKYIVVTVPPKETVLISYLKRNCYCLTKRLKSVVKLYIPEDNLFAGLPEFVSFCQHVVTYKKDLRIKRANVPALSKLGLVDYSELLFDTKAESSEDIDFSKLKKVNEYCYIKSS